MNLSKKILVLCGMLVATSSTTVLAADGGGMYYGLGAGLQMGKASTSSSFPTVGVDLGYKWGLPGLGIFIDYGWTSEDGASGSLTLIGTKFDLFFGDRIFYIGPRVGSLHLSFGGLTANGVFYGAGGGLNIPVGASTTVGVSGDYLVGSILGVSVTDIVGLVNIKFWSK